MARTFRPADLAHEHGLSAQAVRNYEDAGILPPAGRTATGYRGYSATHVQALRTFLALRPGYGHQRATAIMQAANDRDDATLFRLIDQAHAELLHERTTLDDVAAALTALADNTAARTAVAEDAATPTASADNADALTAFADVAAAPTTRSDNTAARAALANSPAPPRFPRGTLGPVDRSLTRGPHLRPEPRRSTTARMELRQPESPSAPTTIGALAHRLELHPATLRKWEQAGILRPQRDRATGYRVYSPEVVRDAHMTRELRRGGYPLTRIKLFLDQLHAAGDTDALHNVLAEWRNRIAQRSRTMLAAAHQLERYLDLVASL